ncbi:spore coat protein JB [Melghiribacillus thermohalophilus]|uniref:Spore coat protein JB n=2 Tax=Melghiribacillus thermohalophilus TaxID=1324956 RepID=A0A4V2V2N0_9BACI|nr:spore coat protein JB [Melghiribacillus thermohalophilus]
MNKTMPPEYYRQLEEIQAIDFVLVELTLYLDTHPKDKEAIEQYNHYARQSKKMKKEFEKQFGPLLQYQSYSGYPWTWDNTPWPWQV